MSARHPSHSRWGLTSWPTLRATVALLAIAMLLDACQGNAAAPSVAPTPTASVAPTPSMSSSVEPDGEDPDGSSSEVSGPCGNPYLPVGTDVRWRYERTAGDLVTPFRQRVEAIRVGGFTLLFANAEGGSRELWTCSPGGLAKVDELPVGPGGGPPPEGTVVFRHRRSRGVTIPSDPEVGTSWRQVVVSFGHFVAGGVRYTERQVATTSSRIVGRESVTTDAGTFDALIVETTYATRKTAPAFGNGIDQRVVVRYTQWWAEGVGLVRRMLTDGSYTTLELVGFRS